MQFEFNSLNLLDNVKQNGAVKASYIWAADGSKRSVADADRSNGFDYIGSIVYAKTNGVRELESANLPDGRIIKTSNGYQVQYYYKDHLGSVRFIESSPIGRDDYMPYGTRMQADGYAPSTSRTKFAGKELQTTGNTSLLDFGARMYDPVLCRWLTNDPLAERYYNVSPYVYAGANPIRYIDPDGRKLVDANGNLMWKNGNWTKYATQGVIKYGNLLRQTNTGKEQFGFMVNHNSDFTFSTADKRTTGDAAFGENEASGITVDDQTQRLKQVKRFHITLYIGEAEDNAMLYGGLLSPDQAMAATFGHEIEHAKDDNLGLSIQQYFAKRNKDTKLANKLESDIEKKPNVIKAQIASEFSGINNTWEKVADLARRYQERIMREQFQKLLSK